MLLGANAIGAQDLSFKRYSVRDGLPGSTVYSTLQDKNGFIWFATNLGVSRFDGRTFRNFSRQDGLPDTEVMKLFLDSHNRVWCTTFAGIPAVFLGDSIVRFDNCHNVTAVAEDQQNNTIYLVGHVLQQQNTSCVLYSALNISGKWVFKKEVRDTPDHWPILAKSLQGINFYFEGEGNYRSSLLLSGPSFVRRYTLRMESGRPFDGVSFAALNNDKPGIAFFGDDSIYYANEHALYSILPVSFFNLRHNLTSLYCENDSVLWLCTRNKGLLRIRNFLTPHKTIESFFPKTFCTTIIKDQENGYWVTTHNDGVYYLPGLSFRTITSYPAFADTDVRSIRNIDSRTVVAGFANGNILFIDNQDLQCKSLPASESGHKNNQVLDIKPLSNDVVLIASDAGLSTISGRKEVRLVEGLDNYMAVKGIFVTPGKTSYVTASARGVKERNLKTNTDSIMFVGRTTCVTGVGRRFYWGTLHGVYMKEDGSKAIDLGAMHPALSGIINHLAISSDSALWALTQEGIVILKDGAITHIGDEDGILSDNCKHVWFDNNVAWIATNKGISRVTYRWESKKLRYVISNVTEEDGLITNDVNQTTTDDKYLWAATAQGISFFSKNYVSESARPPLVNINRIVSGGITLPSKDTIQLQYPDNKLQIELSGISYRSGRNIHYEYRLRQLDGGWSQLAGNVVEFSALPFGVFTFEVRAVDRWGKKSATPKRIVIVNPAPFWKTNTFAVSLYIATAVLMGIAFYILLRRMHRKKEEEYRLSKKMHDLEMTALQAQMNPHFIFNCLASIQYHVMRADIRSATNYLHKFSTLIRQTLHHSTSSSIVLREEIKILALYLDLEKLRLGERMEYNIYVSPDLQADSVYIPSMIVQPYVENAIKHGISPLKDRVGKVAINFERRGDYIDCTIEDNGPGIYAEAKRDVELIGNDHISLGTTITKNRINTLNLIRQKKIKLEIVNKSEAHLRGPGTMIHLSFPILTD